MLVRLVLWSLAESQTTVEELRRYLRDEAVEVFADVPGLRFKAWVSDEATERAELPSRARELIGKDPEVGEEFDVEATIEGRYIIEELSRLGLVFES